MPHTLSLKPGTAAEQGRWSHPGATRGHARRGAVGLRDHRLGVSAWIGDAEGSGIARLEDVVRFRVGDHFDVAG